ncbi:MAG TPA: DUF2934 domain-containing protein [Candidatus Angelobacter sp.]|nr:DUF2934 domain-containing protein [Candidatus Angelobacter sp.]
MATKPPADRPRKASSPKKSVTKQPTPINSHPSATNSHPNAAVLENTPTNSTQPSMEEQIRQRAYQLYEERGCQHGFEQEDWARAEAEIRDKYQQEKSA